MALDSLASELETLRTQWEGTHRAYRLSHQSEVERSPVGGSAGGGPSGGGSELSSSLASWRKRLDAEDREKEARAGVEKVGVSGH